MAWLTEVLLVNSADNIVIRLPGLIELSGAEALHARDTIIRPDTASTDTVTETLPVPVTA
jgi:hypothetical protein